MEQDEGADDAASGDDDAVTMHEHDEGAADHGAERPRGDDGGAQAGEADADGEMDEHGLRQQWQEYARAYRQMERDPTLPASFVAQARKLRDDAERRWRAAKTPHPLSKRLRWAEADLRAAEQKEEAHRAELAQHVEAAARRTRELEDRARIDAERTARKRAVLQELLAEGVPGNAPAADKVPVALAATAITGISTSIAPPLAAAIERLGAPMENDTAESVRQDLQLVAVSISNLEQLLRGTLVPNSPLGAAAAHYDIGSDGGGGGDEADGSTDDGGGGKRRALSAAGGDAATTTRWTKSAGKTTWTRCATSESAKEEAMRLLAIRGGKAGIAVATGGSGGAGGDSGRQAAGAASAPAANASAGSSAETNDLAEAERRARQAAQQQFQQAQLQQLQQTDARSQQQEEMERQQRRQRQEEELRVHQQAIQKAATERAAEEARQRDELLARMSPQELARAAELHAQHMAIGAQAFGTQAASELAGLVHQQHAHNAARGNAAGGMQADADELIALSPEELARWDQEQQGTAGAVPW